MSQCRAQFVAFLNSIFCLKIYSRPTNLTEAFILQEFIQTYGNTSFVHKFNNYSDAGGFSMTHSHSAGEPHPMFLSFQKRALPSVTFLTLDRLLSPRPTSSQTLLSTSLIPFFSRSWDSICRLTSNIIILTCYRALRHVQQGTRGHRLGPRPRSLTPLFHNLCLWTSERYPFTQG